MREMHSHFMLCYFSLFSTFFTKTLTQNSGSGNVLYLCDGETRVLKCDSPDQRIFIDESFYGRTDLNICRPKDTIIPFNVRCSSSTSAYKIWEICNEKLSCQLSADGAAFGNPCKRIPGYIYAKYRCSDPDSSVIGDCPVNSWSSWINSDGPARYGDFELFLNHRNSVDDLCREPSAIEIRLSTGEPYLLGKDSLRLGVNYGVTCHNEAQEDKKCNDYKVRYCCPAECPRPLTPENGFLFPALVNVFTVGERLSYSCDIGYQIIGNPNPVCQPSSNWSSEAPFCKKKDDSVRFCYSPGMPHYETFDGKNYKFGGVCTYTMAATISRTPDVESFSVEIESKYREQKYEKSWFRKVIVRVFGSVIEMNPGRRVQVDERLVRLPHKVFGSYEIFYSGQFVVLTTSFQLMVIYDGRGYVALGLSQRYEEAIQGLCGNMNGNPDDDFTVQGGKVILEDIDQFGNHYLLPTLRSCSEKLNLINNDCMLEKNYVKYKEPCSIITNKKSPLADCISSNSEQRQMNCMYDMCVHGGSLEALEYSISGYVESCQRERGDVKEWRSLTKTPLNCPPHSSYSLCATRCPNTCVNQNSSLSCTSLCVEGCECDEGYVLSDRECVLKSDCGCQFEGNYYQNRDVVYSWLCSRKCVCGAGSMPCYQTTCSKDEECVTDGKGREMCKEKEPQLCRAWGAPHYMTFDGSGWFDFIGLCSYTMSEAFNLPLSDPRWFAVEATSDTKTESEIFFLRSVRIILANKEIDIFLDKNGSVTVNNNAISEAKTDRFEIAHSGLSTLVKTEYGLEVSFTGQVLHIKLGSDYRGKVRGLCGDYNQFSGDDLLLPSGTVANTYDEFAKDYQLGSCQNTKKNPYVCPPNEENKWKSTDYCGALNDAEGPFRFCHSSVNPELFIEKCLFDVCVTKGNEKVLSMALEEYVVACKEKGIELCNWRSDLGKTEMKCPPHSTYNGCAPTCPDTCLNPTASSGCLSSTVEDCVCDFGYLREGKRCVSKYECGCVADGLYIPKGNSILGQEPDTECKCLGFNRLECKCRTGYQRVNGTCQDINECQQRRGSLCHFNAECVNTNGSFYCICEKGLKGDGFVCETIRCRRPANPQNGRIFPDAQNYIIGTRITYVCDDDAELIGFPHRVCEEDGSWANQEPECRPTVKCKRPPFIKNGSYRPGKRMYRIGDEITYICNRGYFLQSDSVRTCLPTGDWSDLSPVCIAKCPLPDNPENGQILATKLEYFEKDWIKYECDDGFIISDDMRQCLKDGTWSGKDPNCTRASCGPPQSILNGNFSSSERGVWGTGSIVQYKCDVGFASAVHSPMKSICLSSGQWSIIPAPCIDIDECKQRTCKFENIFEGIDECLKQNHECHENAVCVNTPGSYVCQCKSGFSGDGKNCQLFIPCPIPNNFENGRVQPEGRELAEVDEVLAFFCNTGYYLDGIGVSQCQADGRWSLKFPSCFDIDECDNYPCHENASCINIPGSFICICPDGYGGDGITECMVEDCFEEDCGCFANGTFYETNELFYTEDCQEQCLCQYGVLECLPLPCTVDEECVMEREGRYQCQVFEGCKLESKIVKLPDDCRDENNLTQQYDAGKCGVGSCSSVLETDYCCGITQQEKEIIQCMAPSGNYKLPVNKITECGCKKCLESEAILFGRVFGMDGTKEIPFEFGEVILQDKVIGNTNKNGEFIMPLEKGKAKYVLHFVERLERFIPTTKVIELEGTGSIFLEIELPLAKEKAMEAASSEDWIIPIGNATMKIKANSVFTKSGVLYKGKITAQPNYINKDKGVYQRIVPGDYFSSRAQLLKFYDIFLITFRGERNEALDVKNAKIYPSAEISILESELENLYLWNLDSVDGSWQQGRKFKKSSENVKDTIVVETELTEIENVLAIASMEEEFCFIKVRGYKTDKYQEEDQLSNLYINGEYKRQGIWHSAAHVITSAEQGGCLPMPCLMDYSFYGKISVKMSGNVSLYPDISSPAEKLDSFYSTNETNNAAKVRFTKLNAFLLRGPVYTSKEECVSSPWSYAHFRFYINPKQVFEFNTVPFDEFNLLRTWFNTPLIWWPNPMEFSTCYVKIGIHGNPTQVRAKSFVGQRSDILGRLYGVRETRSSPEEEVSAACVEFKCSGVFLDSIPDATMLDVAPQGKCTRQSLNKNLLVISKFGYITQRDNSTFRILTLSKSLDHNFGIYSYTSRDVFVSKQTALRMCNSGDSYLSNKMNPSKGVAVTFNCT